MAIQQSEDDMEGILQIKNFAQINLSDPFFDSLKQDYTEFERWFSAHPERTAYTYYNADGSLCAFLCLKIEKGPIEDLQPVLKCNNATKICTLKIDAHHTKLGERFLKKALDYAVSNNTAFCYVTLFDKQQGLLSLFGNYGFEQYGTKVTPNGTEIVLLKNLGINTGNCMYDYPRIDTNGHNKYLLAIKPEWHTKLFPDSILNNESISMLEDVSHTNSIQKVYVCAMRGLASVRAGDLIVIYRSSDEQGRAFYRAVVTSVCTVIECRSSTSFGNFNEFYEYANQYSVFDESGLRYWFNKPGCFVIKMLYNAAFLKRLTNGMLIERFGFNPADYWGFRQMTDEQFNAILSTGGVNESLIIR